MERLPNPYPHPPPPQQLVPYPVYSGLWVMASNADQHAAANGGGGTTPAATGSPPAGKKAAAAAAWKRPGNGAAVPVVVAPGSPIMDADSWPALPGLASPPPTTLTPTPMPPKASPKVAPLPPPAVSV